MEPVTLIVKALGAGAALGARETASSAATDAYAALKAAVSKKLDCRPGSEVMLTRHEEHPETWQAPLMEELQKAGADRDLGLTAAAQALLAVVDGAGTRAGKYIIDGRESQGMQIGDYNTQHITFQAPPSA
jgi:hypothetical protein